MPEFNEQIEAAIAKPAAMSVDGQSVTNRPIGDLVQADQYVAAKAAMRKRRRGIMFTKLIPPGAISDCGRSGIGPEC